VWTFKLLYIEESKTPPRNVDVRYSNGIITSMNIKVDPRLRYNT
jgi:hypothetical protein